MQRQFFSLHYADENFCQELGRVVLASDRLEDSLTLPIEKAQVGLLANRWRLQTQLLASWFLHVALV